ncbi:MAG: hypothetical protein IKY99_10600 [Bacteroidaceae bacterium]|nr:hypothetical protein [Bacteroidaceae bacterium]
MKKNFIKLMLVAMVVVASGVNIYNSQKESGMSDVVLANIDALADHEWDPVNGWVCYSTVYDNTSSEIFFITTRCSDCYTVSATFVSNAGHCWH